MEEDATYISYVKTYHPHTSGEHAHALSLSKIVSLAYRNQGSTLLLLSKWQTSYQQG